MDDHVWAHIDTLRRPHQMRGKDLLKREVAHRLRDFDYFSMTDLEKWRFSEELRLLSMSPGEPVNAQDTMQEEKRDIDASDSRPKRHGSPVFYSLLDEMAETHDKKSHDYATDSDPIGNYHFAGFVANMFSHSADDAGFAGRLAEKMYRLSVLGRRGVAPKNESIDDTERDIAVIATLWMASRRQMRSKTRETGMSNQEQPAGTERAAVANGLNENPLQSQLYDLIKLMPTFQQNDLVSFIQEIQSIRRGKAVITNIEPPKGY